MQPLIRTESESSNHDNVGPPPNGGLKAWAQVVMGHLVIFNSWGYVSSFGIFQSHYTTTLNVTPSAISWIGSIQLFFDILYRHILWQSAWCGILPRSPNLWLLFPSSRFVYNIHLIQLLATSPRARALQRVRGWVNFLPNRCFGSYLFLQEAGVGNSVCCIWRCDWRHHLSSDCTATSSQDRIWVDRQSYGIRYPF